MTDITGARASERTIRGFVASPTSQAINLDATESSPLLHKPTTPASPPSPMVSGLSSVLGRTALVVAAGVVTVCAASGSLHQPTVSATSSAVVLPPRELLLDLYTRGPLLDAVQRSQLFNDSKHFVDMPLKTNTTATQILTEFAETVAPALEAEPAATNDTLRAFLNKHFDEPGSEIQKTVPPDFTEASVPPRIAAIENPGYQHWALALHALWQELGRSPSREVVSSYLQPTPLASLGDTSTTTLIVVPGGRFRESYYWDSYWIVEGLLVSNMRATARRVVQNLLEYVAEFGFVPNGGRIYYLTRSQPPLLSDMVKLVAMNEPPQHQQSQQKQNAETSWDLAYLRAVVPLLEKEYAYWMSTHGVEVNVRGETFQLNRYNATIGEPRPESYREDVRLAEQFFPDDKPRQTKLYNDIIAAAESGWDFSSRWFRDQETLASISLDDVVPVDLNAIMYRFESNLAAFYKLLGNETASDQFTKAASDRARAIELVFWDDDSSSWRDVLRNGTKSPVVSVANYYPLWAGVLSDSAALSAFSSDRERLDRIVRSLRTSGLVQVAGVQTTTKTTGEQWDAPNAWPPLQDIVIEGLLKVGTPDARALATELVRTWIDTSFAAWNQTGLMFEKYNATIVGGLGAGGEYVPQFGFGWTNGVVLKFLTQYQDLLQ